MGKTIWKRIGRWFGWITLIFIVMSIVSGYGWDIRTSDLVSTLTGRLLSRVTAASLHTYVLIPLVLTLIIHVTLAIRTRLTENEKREDNYRKDRSDSTGLNA